MDFSIDEAIKLIDRIVDSNYELKKSNSNEQGIAIELVGQHGLGKSKSIEAYAKENNYAFYKKELAQITDETSLFGYPRKTVEIERQDDLILTDGNTKKSVKKTYRTRIEISELTLYIGTSFGSEKINDEYYKKKNANITLKNKGNWELASDDSELTYSTPDWVTELSKTSKSILLLDEFNRALPLIQAATMNLILDGKYGNWTLPPGCTIILSNNPNNGSYNVTDVDVAGADRKFTINLKPDINSWVMWASGNGIKEECINFLYKCPEVRDNPDAPSYRRWTQFFNAIKNVNLRNDVGNDDLTYVYNIGSIAVGSGNILAFKSFIANHLDILPSINELFDPKVDIKKQMDLLQQAIYYKNESGQNVLRTDITGLLGLRVKGYFRSNKILKLQVDRFESLLNHDIIPKDSLIDILSDISKPDHPNKNQLGYLTNIPAIKAHLNVIGSLNI
jgi:hypothetical protein